jgi:uncharacterized repeat protein (TIGR03803 family)
MTRSHQWRSILSVLWMTLLTAGAAIPLAAQITTLHNFDGTDGISPEGALLLTTTGAYYGTTTSGGSGGEGTIFRMTPGGAVTTVYNFSGTDGGVPFGGLIQATDGHLYGTSTTGGAGGNGTIFRMTLSGALTTLHSFSGSDGSTPYGGLVQGTDGDFYGTTVYGGTNSYGVAYKITPSGAFTVLHNFNGSSTDGAYPYPALIQATDGNFYGTTFSGGGAFEGTVFRMLPGGSVTLVHAFCLAGVPCPDGGNVQAGVIQASDGNLYGTVARGGDSACSLGGYEGCGTIFKVTLGGTFTNLHDFHLSDGGGPVTGLVQTKNQILYGVTPYGGTSSECAGGCGTIYKIAPTGTFSSIYSFCALSGCPDGSFPVGTLIASPSGMLYGSTGYGGATSDGTTFVLP